MAKMKMRNPISLPAGGASQANINKALEEQADYLRNVVQKSVAGLDLESNHSATITANGTTVINPAEGKDGMEKTTVTVAVPLEDNKASTIDVSQYESAVEVTPSDGKTAMKKTTVTLSNIPQIEANKTATIDASSYTEPVEITPTSGKTAMEKTTVTVSNIPVLEASKTATIDVSNYSDPVEIEPTSGKDAMAKTVVTLSNIPSGGSGNFTAYAWSYRVNGVNLNAYLDCAISPIDQSEAESVKAIAAVVNAGVDVLDYLSMYNFIDNEMVYNRVSDTEFKITEDGQTTTFTRNSAKDLVAWVDELDANKAQTIDVSQYSAPVEVTPTVGKDGMRKATITLSNIPSPSSGEIKLALWGGSYGSSNSVWLPFIVAPSTLEDFSKYNVMVFSDYYTPITLTSSIEVTEYTKISDTKFTATFGGGSPQTFELDSEHILTLKTN